MIRIRGRLDKKKIAEWAGEAAAGNVAALEYVLAMMIDSESIDDLRDRDVLVDDDHLEHLFSHLLTGYGSNAFYMENYAALTALQIVAYNAWLDSNEIKDNTEHETPLLYADLLADMVTETLCYVAFRCGGHKHMRNISRIIRGDQLTRLAGE